MQKLLHRYPGLSLENYIVCIVSEEMGATAGQLWDPSWVSLCCLISLFFFYFFFYFSVFVRAEKDDSLLHFAILELFASRNMFSEGANYKICSYT